MIYCFDIDGTICSNTNGDYEKAVPYHSTIEKVNKLFDQGNTIYYYTARGVTTGYDWRKITENQFLKWNVKYHKLFFGKPTADLYIDDKCMSINEWLKEF
jgi:uncharacterized HAD superfamily protein